MKGETTRLETGANLVRMRTDGILKGPTDVALGAVSAREGMLRLVEISAVPARARESSRVDTNLCHACW